MLGGIKDAIEEKVTPKANGIQFVISIPAIVCEGCIKTLMNILVLHCIDLKINLETKQAHVIADPQVVNSDFILGLIIDAGYDDPPPVLSKNSTKRKRKSEVEKRGMEKEKHEEERDNQQEGTGVEGEPSYEAVAPTVYKINIPSAKTANCLEAVINELEALQIECHYTSRNNQLLVRTSTSYFDISKAITKTGHTIGSTNELAFKEGQRFTTERQENKNKKERIEM